MGSAIRPAKHPGNLVPGDLKNSCSQLRVTASKCNITPSLKNSKPIKALNLPKAIADSGQTRIVRVPVRTNANQNATVRVTGTPIAAQATGEVRTFRTFRRDGALWVDLSGTQATRVTVRIRAPRTTTYQPYRMVKVYRTRTAG